MNHRAQSPPSPSFDLEGQRIPSLISCDLICTTNVTFSNDLQYEMDTEWGKHRLLLTPHLWFASESCYDIIAWCKTIGYSSSTIELYLKSQPVCPIRRPQRRLRVMRGCRRWSLRRPPSRCLWPWQEGGVHQRRWWRSTCTTSSTAQSPSSVRRNLLVLTLKYKLWRFFLICCLLWSKPPNIFPWKKLFVFVLFRLYVEAQVIFHGTFLKSNETLWSTSLSTCSRPNLKSHDYINTQYYISTRVLQSALLL